MRHVRRQDEYRVDAAVCEQLSVIGINLCVRRTVFCRSPLRSLAHKIAECHHVGRILLLLHAGEMLAVCDTAASDKAHFQFCAHNIDSSKTRFLLIFKNTVYIHHGLAVKSPPRHHLR